MPVPPSQIPGALRARPMFPTGIAPPERVPDSYAPKCMACSAEFALTLRRHHCRGCGGVFCGACTAARLTISQFRHYRPVRVCGLCTEYLLARKQHDGDPDQNLRAALQKLDTALWPWEFSEAKGLVAVARCGAAMSMRSAAARRAERARAGEQAHADELARLQARVDDKGQLRKGVEEVVRARWNSVVESHIADKDSRVRWDVLCAKMSELVDSRRDGAWTPTPADDAPIVSCASTPRLCRSPALGAAPSGVEVALGMLRDAVALHNDERVVEAQKQFTAAYEEAHRAGEVGDPGFQSEWAASAGVRAKNDAVMERVQYARALVSDNTDMGWKEMSTFNGIRTLYRADGRIHMTRVEGEVSTPMFYIMALLSEIDLYPLWVPSMLSFGLTKNTHVINQPSVNKREALIDVKLPFPVAHRECCFFVDGVVDVEEWNNRQIILLLNSQEDSQYCTLPDCKKGCVRVDLAEGSSIILKPAAATPGVTYMQALVKIDPKMMMVPDWMLNFFMRMFAFIMIEGVRRAGEVLGREEYRRRYLDPNNAFYNMLRDRIRRDLPEQADTIPPVGFGHMRSPLPGMVFKDK